MNIGHHFSLSCLIVVSRGQIPHILQGYFSGTTESYHHHWQNPWCELYTVTFTTEFKHGLAIKPPLQLIGGLAKLGTF